MTNVASPAPAASALTPITWRLGIAGGVIALGVAAYLAQGVIGTRGQAFAGVFCFFGLVAMFSSNLRAVNWRGGNLDGLEIRFGAQLEASTQRTIGWGVALQVVLALLVLKVPFVNEAFNKAKVVVVSFINFSDKGAEFVFGNLARPGDLALNPGKEFLFMFAFKALPPKSHTPPLRLLCFGGSQGSRILSEGLLHAIDSLPPEEELTIVHQTGATQREAVQAAYEAKGRKAEVIAFIEDMSKALGEADLVLGRAGGSIAELTVAGKASVLVPLKSAADDHQTMNARAMQDAGAAVMVEEKDLVTLGAVITDLVRNPSKIEQLETRARALGRPDAAAKVATMLLDWAGVRSAAA